MPLECPDSFQDGPILDFLAHADRFDAVHLVYDPPKEELGATASLERALAARDSARRVFRHPLPITDPRDYPALYRNIRATCRAAESQHPDATFHVLLTPGTPQVHAIWVLLSKTVFRATTWQTSEATGAAKAERVEIPFDIDAELIEPARVEAARRPPANVDGLVYASKAIDTAVARARLAGAAERLPVLIRGETGVGKEIFARIVHEASSRRRGPLVTVNCAALPPTLSEDALFGHVRGGFTGATSDRKGHFEEANGGTLFLDEVAELAPHTQAALLRAIQYGRIRRVGGAEEVAVDARVIAATHQPLEALIRERSFRHDLYERLRGVEVRIPPLRERREDVRVLADHFMERLKGRGCRLLPSAYRALELHSWPGNVRELELLVTRLVALASKQQIGEEDVRRELAHQRVIASERLGAVPVDLNEAVASFELELLERALELGGTQAAGARLIGLSSQQAFAARLASVRRRASGRPRGSRAR
jgi:transcriptional regulator with GAF, ATPase, and Fis domain